MKCHEKTIKGLFDQEDLQYQIPDYQRAYSWEESQLKDFLKDLIEHTNSNKNYYFGNIIVKTIKEDECFEVIDGQQRLTTITLFAKAVIELLCDFYNEDFDYKKEKRLFIKSSMYKLQPVSYDKAYFVSIIDENKLVNIETPSQKRLKLAIEYFSKELEKINDKNLVFKIYQKMKSSKVNFLTIESDGEDILMFELQNNRGKQLTSLEKIRSFLMYKMYNLSKKDEIEENIKYIKNLMDPIYSMIMTISQKVKYNEDDILLYHCYAFTKIGTRYRDTDNLSDLRKEYDSAENKIEWIKSFVSDLHNSFSNTQKMLMFNSEIWCKLKSIHLSHDGKIPAYIFAFILKGMKYIGVEENGLIPLLKILEEIRFRELLIPRRAKIYEKINNLLIAFDGNINILKSNIKFSISEYWGDNDAYEKLTHNMNNNDMINYILHEYENSIQLKGYKVSISITDEEIEHISPQTEPQEVVETGYETNDEGFYTDDSKDKYLNCIGNLMLISKSHNSSIGNDKFKNKLLSYKQNPALKQQMEIVRFAKKIENYDLWDHESIEKRKSAILDFVCERWNICKPNGSTLF